MTTVTAQRIIDYFYNEMRRISLRFTLLYFTYCRHYKSHGKERLKRKDLMRPQKTDIESADVICWYRI